MSEKIITKLLMYEFPKYATKYYFLEFVAHSLIVHIGSGVSYKYPNLINNLMFEIWSVFNYRLNCWTILFNM